MLTWFFRRHCPQYKIIDDPYEFKNHSTNCVALFFDCGCDDNVVPNAVKWDFLFATSRGLLLRDLEMSRCYSEIINATKSGCPNLSKQLKITLMIRPGFETLYDADTSIIRRVITQRFDETHGHSSGKRPQFLADLNHVNWGDSGSLKTFLGKYQIAPQKPETSSRFFSQFDFINSGHPYFVRLRTLLQPCMTCL